MTVVPDGRLCRVNVELEVQTTEGPVMGPEAAAESGIPTTVYATQDEATVEGTHLLIVCPIELYLTKYVEYRTSNPVVVTLVISAQGKPSFGFAKFMLTHSLSRNQTSGTEQNGTSNSICQVTS